MKTCKKWRSQKIHFVGVIQFIVKLHAKIKFEDINTILKQKSSKDKFLQLPTTSFHILKILHDNLVAYTIKYIFFNISNQTIFHPLISHLVTRSVLYEFHLWSLGWYSGIFFHEYKSSILLFVFHFILHQS